MPNKGWARRVADGLSSLRDRAAARLAALRFNPSRKDGPFADDERVSLGDGCYISGKDANRLGRMAREAELDDRPMLSLKGMSPAERVEALTTWPAPFRLNLGEMTKIEMISHLTMVSDYNKARGDD